MDQKICREDREFGNFAKTQGILFAQVVNSLIIKVKDIAIFATKIPIFSRSWTGLPRQFCVRNSHKFYTLAQGKFAVRRGKNMENTGNLKIQFEWVLWYLISLCNVCTSVRPRVT